MRRSVAIAPASPERLYIATIDAEPVAVLEAFSAQGIIGYYALASTTAVRGKGYTAAMIINALREAKKAVADPGVAANLTAQSLDPMHMTTDEFAQLLKAEYDKYEKVVKISGARLD